MQKPEHPLEPTIEELESPLDIIRQRLDDEHLVSTEVCLGSVRRLDWDFYRTRAALIYEEDNDLTTMRLCPTQPLPADNLPFYALAIAAMNNLLIKGTCRMTLGLLEEKGSVFLRLDMERDGWPGDTFDPDIFTALLLDWAALLFFSGRLFSKAKRRFAKMSQPISFGELERWMEPQLYMFLRTTQADTRLVN